MIIFTMFPAQHEQGWSQLCSPSLLPPCPTPDTEPRTGHHSSHIHLCGHASPILRVHALPATCLAPPSLGAPSPGNLRQTGILPLATGRGEHREPSLGGGSSPVAVYVGKLLAVLNQLRCGAVKCRVRDQHSADVRGKPFTQVLWEPHSKSSSPMSSTCPNPVTSTWII